MFQQYIRILKYNVLQKGNILKIVVIVEMISEQEKKA